MNNYKQENWYEPNIYTKAGFSLDLFSTWYKLEVIL
jgi:hypothetical protein